MKTGNLDGNGIAELQNYKFQNLSTAPTTNVSGGRFYFSTTDETLYIYANGAWKDALGQGVVYQEGTGIDITGNTISVDTSVIAQKSELSSYVPTSRTVNGKALSSNISLTASDVDALPDTTKYGAGIEFSVDSTTYVLTATLKDQDGNTLGTAQTVDLPLESVVVSGAYDDTTKEVVLTLQSGSTVRFSVADLVSGLQTEITSSNKLNSDLVSDTNQTNKFVTASDKTTWNGKQDAISDLATIRSGASKGATSVQSYSATNSALTATGGVCTWTVTHNLDNTSPTVAVYEVATGDKVMYDYTVTNANTITVKILSASNISAGTYRVGVQG